MDWHRPLGAIYLDEDGATTRISFDEVAEICRFANVLKADGLTRRPASRCSRHNAGAADRLSRRVPLRHDLDPLFALVRRGRAEFRLSNLAAKAIVTDRDWLGEARENPGPAARFRNVCDRATAPPAPNPFWSSLRQRRVHHRRYLTTMIPA
jgi:acetyl-CoA synthetase